MLRRSFLSLLWIAPVAIAAAPVVATDGDPRKLAFHPNAFAMATPPLRTVPKPGEGITIRWNHPQQRYDILSGYHMDTECNVRIIG